VVDDVSFTVHRGEVVGIAGVEGNGQGELIEALLGLRPTMSGRVLFGDEDVTEWATRERRESGVAYIPEDRHRRGLLLPSPLWENAMLGHQSSAPYGRGPWTDRSASRHKTEQIIEDYDVRTPGIDVAAYSLSGGNQQKLIVGRELSSNSQILLANHPTRGIDIGAQAAVWEQLRQARSDGLAVMLVSADLEELIGLSDRLLVMLRGRLVADLDPQTVTPEVLGSYMTGARTDSDGEAA
jgi:simple sugar transport system ATP-binding protein